MSTPWNPRIKIAAQALVLFVALGTAALIQTEFPRGRPGAFLAVRAEILPHLTLGFGFVTADLIWLRLIQDIDHKESTKVSKGWVFHMLDGITTLDPKYRIVYMTGSTVLSVIVDDAEGARIIFDRGVKNLPNEWSLIYRAAYHYLYEIGDCSRAAELFVQASKIPGAPTWVASLASRLYERAGRLEIARTVVVDALKRFEGTYLEPRLKERLAQIDEAASSPGKDLLPGEFKCKDPSKSVN